MVKLGDIVFVQTKGICEVCNITKNAFVGADKSKEYYVLKPIDTSNNMMVYFPVDTKVNIRKLSSKSKAENIYKNFSELDDVVVDNEDERFKIYAQIVQGGELENWAKLLKTMLIRKSKSNKKQFNFQEQKYINTMLSCVVSELAYILGKDKQEIKSSLCEQLSVSE